MKDTSYLYYHCIRNTIFPPLYQCTSYDDPFDIPIPEHIITKTDMYNIDSIIIPVHRWIPTWYHSCYITKKIQTIFQIQIQDEHK